MYVFLFDRAAQYVGSGIALVERLQCCCSKLPLAQVGDMFNFTYAYANQIEHTHRVCLSALRSISAMGW
jgi:hypothetical protein